MILSQNMYRPFITCDDSKGVVECGTIIKSKRVSHKMESKVETPSKQKNYDRSSSPLRAEKEDRKLSKVSREEYYPPRSFQLLEIFKETQKLNHVIDSWSRDLNHGVHSKDIENDLLKGSLDLQESLVMLGKLQEASKYMAQLKKKQNEKQQKGRDHEMEIEGTHRFQSRGGNRSIEFRKLRLSTDESSRDFIEEVRKTVRDIGEQSNPITEKPRYGGKKMSLDSDMPSTSSSHSSVFQSNSSQSISSSRLSTSQPKVKSPNVVARLMGLDDMPQTSLEQNPRGQLENDRIMGQRRTAFDIEIPKIRKPQTIIHKDVSEPRSLNQVLETMKLASHPHHSRGSHSELRLADDFPPIVLIKPLPVECLESEEELAPIAWKEGVLNTGMLRAETKLQGRIAPKSTQYKEGYLDFSKRDYKIEAEETAVRVHIQKEGSQEHKSYIVESNEKGARPINEKERATCNRIDKKLESEDFLKKRTKSRVSTKMQALKPITHQQEERAEKTNKHVDRIRSDVSNKKKLVEEDVVNRRGSPKSQGQSKVASKKQRKLENRIVVMKTQTPQQHRKEPKTPHQDCKDQKERDKPISEVKAAKMDNENLACENVKSSDLGCNNDSVLESSSSTRADQLATQTKADVLTIQKKEHCSDNQRSLCNFPLLNCEYAKDFTAESSEEAVNHDNHIGNPTSFKKGSHLKDLLLSNPSFLTQAAELSHLNLGCHQIVPTMAMSKYEEADMKLYLDYANEFTGRRSLQDSVIRHPLLPSYVGSIRCSLTLNQLVEEICDGLKTLESYSDTAGTNPYSDDLFAILDRDIGCKEVASGTWDLGWRNEFSAAESEICVIDLEQLLVDELIEELFA